LVPAYRFLKDCRPPKCPDSGRFRRVFRRSDHINVPFQGDPAVSLGGTTPGPHSREVPPCL